MAKIASAMVMITAMEKTNCRSMPDKDVTYRMTPTTSPW